MCKRHEINHTKALMLWHPWGWGGVTIVLWDYMDVKVQIFSLWNPKTITSNPSDVTISTMMSIDHNTYIYKKPTIVTMFKRSEINRTKDVMLWQPWGCGGTSIVFWDQMGIKNPNLSLRGPPSCMYSLQTPFFLQALWLRAPPPPVIGGTNIGRWRLSHAMSTFIVPDIHGVASWSLLQFIEPTRCCGLDWLLLSQLSDGVLLNNDILVESLHANPSLYK